MYHQMYMLIIDMLCIVKCTDVASQTDETATSDITIMGGYTADDVKKKVWEEMDTLLRNCECFDLEGLYDERGDIDTVRLLYCIINYRNCIIHDKYVIDDYMKEIIKTMEKKIYKCYKETTGSTGKLTDELKKQTMLLSVLYRIGLFDEMLNAISAKEYMGDKEKERIRKAFDGCKEGIGKIVDVLLYNENVKVPDDAFEKIRKAFECLANEGYNESD